jgi:hypothetical protein
MDGSDACDPCAIESSFVTQESRDVSRRKEQEYFVAAHRAATSFNGIDGAAEMGGVVDRNPNIDVASVDVAVSHSSRAECISASEDSEQTHELLSEEGRELGLALEEARAALSAARQFVTSPTLETATCQRLQLRKSSSVQEHGNIGGSCNIARCDNCTDDSVADTPLPHPPPPHCGLAPPREPPFPRVSGLSREHLNALHVRFGTNAAKSRVQRARSVELSELAAQRRKEAEEKTRKEIEDAVKVESSRRLASKRMAAHRRAQQEAAWEEEEAKRAEDIHKAACAAADGRYGRACARRVSSEYARKAALAAEVASDLHDLQSKRRAEGDAKGEELRRKCEASEWSDSKAVVSSRGPIIRRGRRCASAGCRPAQAPGLRAPSPRAPAAAVSSRTSAAPAQHSIIPPSPRLPQAAVGAVALPRHLPPLATMPTMA